MTAPVQNDTYGEISRDELAGLRATAACCLLCGMLATVDPVFHASRYGHAPEVMGDGSAGAKIRYRWGTSHSWIPA